MLVVASLGWYDWRGGDEVEEASTPGEWKRKDEEAKHSHLEYQEGKDLSIRGLLEERSQPMSSRES